MTGIRNFKGRVAVVTGGASGIGKGLAHQLVREGATVVIADNDSEQAAPAAREVGARPYVLDVRDAAAVAELARWTVAELGRVDFVANNAGVAALAPFDDLSLRDFDWMIDINLRGVVHVMKAFLPVLSANPDGGHILNTASAAGLVALPGMSAYAATKFAVVALTESVRAELEAAGSAVAVSVLTPAQIYSNIGANALKRPWLAGATPDNDEQLPGGRWLQPDEAAALILDSVKRNDPYVLTHPELLGDVRQRHERIERAFELAANR